MHNIKETVGQIISSYIAKQCVAVGKQCRGKPGKVRIFERDRSVEDFSISYAHVEVHSSKIHKQDDATRKKKKNCHKAKRNKDMLLGDPIYNFRLIDCRYNLAEGILIKKNNRLATTHVFVSAPPVRHELKIINHKEVLCLYFDCDVIYTESGTRRYQEEDNNGSEKTT